MLISIAKPSGCNAMRWELMPAKQLETYIDKAVK